MVQGRYFNVLQCMQLIAGISYKFLRFGSICKNIKQQYPQRLVTLIGISVQQQSSILIKVELVRTVSESGVHIIIICINIMEITHSIEVLINITVTLGRNKLLVPVTVTNFVSERRSASITESTGKCICLHVGQEKCVVNPFILNIRIEF